MLKSTMKSTKNTISYTTTYGKKRIMKITMDLIVKALKQFLLQMVNSKFHLIQKMKEKI